MRKKSVGITMDHTVENGHPKDANIHPGSPMGDVIKVVLQPFSQRSVPAPSMNLSPASNTSFNGMPSHIIRNSLAKFINKDRSFWSWANQTHFSTKNINQLGKLINTGLRRKVPRIVLRSSFFAAQTAPESFSASIFMLRNLSI